MSYEMAADRYDTSHPAIMPCMKYSTVDITCLDQDYIELSYGSADDVLNQTPAIIHCRDCIFPLRFTAIAFC